VPLRVRISDGIRLNPLSSLLVVPGITKRTIQRIRGITVTHNAERYKVTVQLIYLLIYNFKSYMNVY